MGSRFWTSIKNPSSVIYANRHYLEIYRMYHPERLFKQKESNAPTIVRKLPTPIEFNWILSCRLAMYLFIQLHVLLHQLWLEYSFLLLLSIDYECLPFLVRSKCISWSRCNNWLWCQSTWIDYLRQLCFTSKNRKREKKTKECSSIKNTCSLKDHCCVLYSIIAWNSTIGPWSRVEGTPNGQ